MTRPNYGGAGNPHYHQKPSSATNKGCGLKFIVVAAVVLTPFVLVLAQVLDYVMRLLAGVM